MKPNLVQIPSKIGLWTCCLLLASSVGLASQPNDPVLATSDAGTILRSDVEREIRFLTQQEARFRDEKKMAEGTRWRDWIHRLALRQIALREAAASGLLDDAATREQIRLEVRRWLVDQWRSDCYGSGLQLPEPAELERLATERVKKLPPRLRLSHIFLRTHNEEEARRARQSLGTWREEIGGDLGTFQRYAREHSDSLTAARGGPLGFFRQGKLPAELEAVLYTLPEGTVSPPLPLRGGWHLFYIERNTPARTSSLKLATSELRGELTHQAKEKCKAQALIKARQERTVQVTEESIQVGDWKIARPLHARVTQGGEIETTIEEELLFQSCLASGWPEQAHRDKLTDVEADLYLRLLITAYQEQHQTIPTPKEERAFFGRHADRYKVRAKIDPRALTATVPEGKDPLVWMEDFTELARKLRQGEISWPEAEKACAPECKLIDLPAIEQLSFASQYGPTALKVTKALPIGGVSSPIQDQARFHILQIQARETTRQQSFEEALPRVRRAIRHNERGTLTEELVLQLLTAYHFKLTSQGIERTHPTGEQQAEEASKDTQP